jgi:hypothetical protein
MFLWPGHTPVLPLRRIWFVREVTRRASVGKLEPSVFGFNPEDENFGYVHKDHQLAAVG